MQDSWVTGKTISVPLFIILTLTKSPKPPLRQKHSQMVRPVSQSHHWKSCACMISNGSWKKQTSDSVLQVDSDTFNTMFRCYYHNAEFKSRYCRWPWSWKNSACYQFPHSRLSRHVCAKCIRQPILDKIFETWHFLHAWLLGYKWTRRPQSFKTTGLPTNRCFPCLFWCHQTRIIFEREGKMAARVKASFTGSASSVSGN